MSNIPRRDDPPAASPTRRLLARGRSIVLPSPARPLPRLSTRLARHPPNTIDPASDVRGLRVQSSPIHRAHTVRIHGTFTMSPSFTRRADAARSRAQFSFRAQSARRRARAGSYCGVTHHAAAAWGGFTCARAHRLCPGAPEYHFGRVRRPAEADPARHAAVPTRATACRRACVTEHAAATGTRVATSARRPLRREVGSKVVSGQVSQKRPCTVFF